MTKTLLKNIEKGKILHLLDLVQYQAGQIVSKTLIQNKSVSLTVFAFAAGEEISSHASHGDALVSVLDGTARITIGGEVLELGQGDSVVMPAEVPHAVFAQTEMKFLLTVVF
jgi:quercetin dioxygenase-like cupin family protein